MKKIKMKKITVKPSSNLFIELGNNTYEYVDLLSEFIDNAIAARYGDKLLEIKIVLGFSSNKPKEQYFLIRDNAMGIKFDELGDAISPGALSGGSGLNEHGLGMKEAIASLGTLEYLLTKTKDDSKAHKINKFDWGELDVDEVDVDWDSGTEIKIKNVNPIVDISKINYTRTYVKKLGARYRRFLKSSAPKMSLIIEMKDIDNNETIDKWTVTEIKPVYFHPNRRQNSPVIEKKKFSGKGWEAELTFGYAPTENQYEELGLEKADMFHPYYVSINKQGLDILRNDRVVNFHQFSEIGVVRVRHNDYNSIRGEIDLKKGFRTAITKNSLIYDEHLSEFLDKLKTFLNDSSKGYLKRKAWPKEIPENILRDRLAKHLKEKSIDPKKDVSTEYPIEALGGFIDILADKEAYEIKTTQANGVDIYQLFAYLDMGDIDSGIFVAPDYSTGAQETAKHINEKYKKRIILAKLEEFPINYPLKKDEMV